MQISQDIFLFEGVIFFSDLEMDMYGDTMEEGECNPDAERKGKTRIIITDSV